MIRNGQFSIEEVLIEETGKNTKIESKLKDTFEKLYEVTDIFYIICKLIDKEFCNHNCIIGFIRNQEEKFITSYLMGNEKLSKTG